MLRRSRSGARPVCIVALAASLSGCGARTDFGTVAADVQVAVGRLEGTDAVIATVRDSQGTVAYVCGGPTTFEQWTRWYRSDATALDLSLATGDWSLEIDDDGLSGSMWEPSGIEHGWTAAIADGGAGLFSAVDAGCRAGVVVDGSLGVQGVWCDDLGHFAQVTPVMPIGLEHFDVSIDLPEGIRVLGVERATSTSLLAP